jgi:ubiquinone/menaquinone biosynthesis C-methylase UbiE
MQILKKILNNHEYLIERFLVEQELKMKPNQKILDAGAGQCQYKHIFDKRHQYISQDLCVGDKDWDFSHIDIKSNIECIPLESGTFDYILLTQVLEHVPEPQKVMDELSRLLKPTGKIIMSVPQCVGEHQQPYHFFNFTRFGIGYLANKSNLKINTLETMGGYFTHTSQMLQIAGYKLLGQSLLTKIVFYPFRLVVCLFGLLLDQYDTNKTITTGYLVVLTKQGERPQSRDKEV